MIHAIYIKTNEKADWWLASIVATAEAALKEKESCLKIAKKHGNKDAEVAIKTYQTAWFMPETLKELKENTKLLYN